MKKAEYDQLRAQFIQDERTYRLQSIDLLAKADSKREALVALDRVWQEISGERIAKAPELLVFGPSGQVSVQDAFAQTMSDVMAQSRTWWGRVHEAIDALPEVFTTQDVNAHVFLTAKDTPSNRATISGTLKRMADGRELLELVEVGSGARPSRYRKINGHKHATIRGTIAGSKELGSFAV